MRIFVAGATGALGRQLMPKLVELYRQGRLKLDELITRTYPLADVNEAMGALSRGEVLRAVLVM